MKVLITGASGQIGTNLALALIGRGDTVVGVDKRPNEWTDSFETHIVDLVELARRRQPIEARRARDDILAANQSDESGPRRRDPA